MSERYSIIFSSYDDIANPHYAGGGARAVHEVARRLALKHTVTVLTGNYKGAKNEVRDRVLYRRIGFLRGAKAGQLSFFASLPYYVKKLPFDVWVESFTPPFSTACLQRFTSKPVIGLVHMLGGADMKRKYHLPFDRIERWGLKKYDRFIVLTPASRDLVQRMHPDARIDIIPNGIERSLYGDTAEKKHILCLGRIEVEQKGLDILVRAYERIADEVGCPLIIAGSGSSKEEAKLREIIAHSTASRNIVMVGKVDGLEKIRLLREAYCLAVPSRFETFSLVALEALSVGTPVITFNLPELQWIPDQVVVRIESFDEVALARALFCAVKKESESLLDTAMPESFWKRYDWDRVARRYEGCIRKAIVHS